MVGVPFLDASFVAFPTAEPGSVALLPADEADVTAALVETDLDELLAVLYFVLMDSADVVRGFDRLLVDVRVLVFVDDAEELCDVDAIVVGRLDGGSHLGVRGVADDDALAAGSDKVLDRSRDLLGYMPLIDVDKLYAQCICCGIQDALALRTEHVCRAPDRNTNLDLIWGTAACLVACLTAAACKGEYADQEHRNRT